MMLYGYNQNPDRHINDLYTTDPQCVRDLIELEDLKGYNILEPCAGLGHMVDELKKDNHVISNEMFDYGYKTDYRLDYLNEMILSKIDIDVIVMNPPFKHSNEFIKKSLEMCDKVYVFEKLTLLEGVARYKELFSMNMLKRVYVYSFRPKCLKNGNPRSGMLLAYAWFVFDKNHKGKPTIDWITRDSRNNYC